MKNYSFGNFLYELRTRIGLTQYQLGALVGVSDKAVSKWENGSSMPQSNLLNRLSEVLGVSVDELLTCKYHSFDKKDEKGVFAMEKQFWEKVFAAMHERFGNPAPIEVVNRLLSEQAELQGSEMIAYFDFLSLLAEETKKREEHLLVRGAVGSSLVSYLLDITPADPMKPHYECPVCHAFFFDDSARDSWDLPPKTCSCGAEMKADGHNIPFDVIRHAIHHNAGFSIGVSPEMFDDARGMLQDYFEDCTLTKEDYEPVIVSHFSVSAGGQKRSVMLFRAEMLTLYKALEQATHTRFDEIRITPDEMLQAFRECDTDGITEFKSDFMKNMLCIIAPKTFYELLQISGFAHGTHVWTNNGSGLIKQGYSASDIIAFRDDVFDYVQTKMHAHGLPDTGLAFTVMENARKGFYEKDGIPADEEACLRAIGAEEWFMDSIKKVMYLFPKAQGVACVKTAIALMWYKLYHPQEFYDIIL